MPIDPVTGAIIGGSVGGLGNFFGGKSANRPRTERTDQTTTQSTSPFGPALPFLNFGLNQSLINFLRPTAGAFPELNLPEFGAVGSGISPAGRALLDKLGSGGGTGGFLGLGRPFIKDLLEGDVGENPYLNELAAAQSDEALRVFNESILPQTTSRFSQGGQFTSGLASGAKRIATERFNEDVQRNITDLFSRAFSENLGAQTAVATSLPQFAQAALAPRLAALQGEIGLANNALQARLQAQQLAYQSALAGYGADKDAFFFNENLPAQRLNQFLSGILPIAGLGGTTTTRTTGTNVVPGANVSPFGAGALGALGGGAAGYGFGNKFGGGNLYNTSPVGNPFFGNVPFTLPGI